jgi:hypothetical protein
MTVTCCVSDEREEGIFVAEMTTADNVAVSGD